MSEKKSIFKTARKQLERQQEKLRHKLKGEEVEDEELQEYVANFQAQVSHANKLYKECTHFLKTLNSMAAASRSFGDAIKVVYDPDWANSREAYGNLETITTVYETLSQRLKDEVVAPLSAYIDKFPEIKARVAKRDRKYLSFERAKRNLEHARTKDNKQKITQCEEAFEVAKEEYEQVDAECRQTLPSFYDGRVSFYGSVLQSCFAVQANFHGTCNSIVQDLQTCVDGVLDTQSSIPAPNKPPKMADVDVSEADYVDDSEINHIVSKMKTQSLETYGDNDDDDDDGDDEMQGVEDMPASVHVTAPVPDSEDDEDTVNSTNDGDASTNTENDVLEVRVATHPYAGQDEDELTFEKGAIIHVIPFEDPEDEEDGWLYGRYNGKSGLFPLNHTEMKG